MTAFAGWWKTTSTANRWGFGAFVLTVGYAIACVLGWFVE